MIPGFSLLALVPPFHSASSTPPQYFNLTAISAANGKSTLECWQLTTPLSISSTAGISGTAVQQLGNTANLSYAVIPPKFHGGQHNAPSAQYVVFLSGEAVVTLPEGTDNATIKGGPNAVIIAADVAALSTKGHITTYPSNDNTVAIQAPVKDGKLPAHKVLHEGACRACELTLDDLTPPKKC